MRKNIAILAAVVVLILGIVAAVLVTRSSTDVVVAPAASGPFARPTPWLDVRESATGVISSTAMAVGGLEIQVPQPAGAKIAWKRDERDGRPGIVGTGTVLGGAASFDWRAGQGNPHTVFSGTMTLPTSALTAEIVSELSLPNGELTYVDATLSRAPFASEPMTLSALTAGTIVWRDGDRTLTLWQWTADRVTIAASDAGGFVVRFHWWDPAQHELPEECDEALAKTEWKVDAAVVISFGRAPDLGVGRLPSGVASAVVPIFVDPYDAEPKFRDGASPNAADFANRARTIAMGHSSPEDARHGNGGLAGLGVGGTIVIPEPYAGDQTAFAELTSTLEQTTIELAQESDLRPRGCEKWLAAQQSPQRALLGHSVDFDGKFPNLLGAEQRHLVPGFGTLAPTWHPTRLTGRRKDVVTQALSPTYLSRLAERRGLAVLEIPVVASRNPLVPAASEALLGPERQGHWTIEESLARSLAEVELLSEGSQFDLLGLQELTAFTRAIREVVIDEGVPGEWLVHNGGEAHVTGFTLVVDGLVTAMVDDTRVEQTTRTIGNGSEQTWLWWDLAPGATYKLRLEAPDSAASRAVRWTSAD